VAGLLQRLRAWWTRDRVELEDEATHVDAHEREVLEEDYEGRKDDVRVEGGYLAGGAADFERDSEPPKY
jgi:hypothetical protein